jgi:FKBP-type peptidyl-prolyl cis-trans isomerase
MLNYWKSLNMKKNLLFLFLPAVMLISLASCGDEVVEDEVEKIEFKDTKDKLSYAFGVDNAVRLFGGDPKFEALDRDMLKKGFESNLSADQPTECDLILQQFLGQGGYDFDTTYLKQGSECIGKITATMFFMQMTQLETLSEVNLDMVKKGFAQGLLDQDTVNMSVIERTQLIDDFSKRVQAKQQAKQQAMDNANISGAPAFWEKIKAMPGIKQVGTSGIYYETVVAGTGGTPTEASDIEAHYILTYGATGDTLETSYRQGVPIRINLAGVIPGWREGFTALKKGGKYRLYIPYAKAYMGMQGGPQGPLCFYIEFLNFGPAGSIAPPPQQAQQQGF